MGAFPDPGNNNLLPGLDPLSFLGGLAKRKVSHFGRVGASASDQSEPPGRMVHELAPVALGEVPSPAPVEVDRVRCTDHRVDLRLKDARSGSSDRQGMKPK